MVLAVMLNVANASRSLPDDTLMQGFMGSGIMDIATKNGRLSSC